MNTVLVEVGLFAGIGGFSIGARLEGIESVFHCELNTFCQNVLRERFPRAGLWDDIKTLKASTINEYIKKNYADTPVAIILTGGFPCQDLSSSGKGAGIAGPKSSLWFEYLRLIDELRPPYLVIENSPNLLKKGFEKVLYPLSEIGYDAEWQCLQTSQFGLPHQRERVFVIAYPNVQRREGILCFNEDRFIEEASRTGTNALDSQRNPFLRFEKRVGQPAVLGVDDGFPNRVDALAACGNAVSPVVARFIFKCIKHHYYN